MHILEFFKEKLGFNLDICWFKEFLSAYFGVFSAYFGSF